MTVRRDPPSLDAVLGTAAPLRTTRLEGDGPAGRLPLTPEILRSALAYRNDAAIVMRRPIRSLPTASGVFGIATCDKGLPATMLALAGTSTLPGSGLTGTTVFPPGNLAPQGSVTAARGAP